MKSASAMRLWLDRLYLSGALVSALAILLICLLILARVIGRWFGIIVPAADALSGYLLATSAFMAMAYTFRHGGHIRVSLVITRLPPWWQKRVETGVLLLASLFAAYLTWQLIYMVWETWMFKEVTTGYLAFPLFWVQWTLPLGMGLFTLSLIDGLLMGTGAETSGEGGAAHE
ncbi:TRAP transporter small permease [Shewanella submarina]|uniref:TRAP transporter small permease protein n=1 Tax=Shewanella submarina TaxID=2016376 RepID=A0ABV7GH23_9GAMM|nr:TRAP transporter small permease [Shewanella submarina]MCL1035665.1 TRAP transporter small permease [Shewanella submarina]